MAPPRSPRCPRCGFGFAWDGRKCGHCPTPVRARLLWDTSRQLSEILNPTVPAPERALTAFACNCIRRIWDLVPQPARDVVEVIESGADRSELREVFDAWRADPTPLHLWVEAPPEQHAARAVRDLAAALLTPPPEGLPRVAYDVGVRCQRADGYKQFPAIRLEDIPLPAESEQYRAGVIAVMRERPVTAHQMMQRDEDDPERQTLVYLTDGQQANFQERNQVQVAEQAAQCDIARDVLGYPEVVVDFRRDWRTSTAVAMARGMHESRDFFAMPILADALQDAGCDNPEVLEHCRGEQPHFRGCWVIEHLLQND